uniref:BRCT domain-containing protein n=1 Tax=Kwoniella dejecticola CBS 10117 TaxID=1296121 RepID=A0A1A6AFA1_9TREE|nr:uncharacterized protein I303_00553 [Kwoniella dejecticola CBS 10117]OBR88736.1 hypothetical protein I303_00553 [Kwoniella dejecticola CBS 10117]
MTSPKIRRQSSSTSAITQPLGTSSVTRTRSSARLAASTSSSALRASASIAIKNKLVVYDENASSPFTGADKVGALRASASTKNLRSRGPPRESKSISNMNSVMVSESKLSEKGKMLELGAETEKTKRKLEGSSPKGARKVPKVTITHKLRSSTNNGIRKEQVRLRSVGHQSSSESLRSLQPSVSSIPSTPSASIPTTTTSTQPLVLPIATNNSQSLATAPTPARELLKKVESDGVPASPTDSPPSHIAFVARPPTPPRMKERPVNTMSFKSIITSIPVTPRKDEKMDVDKPLSRMPASLRKTPGPPTMPASLSLKRPAYVPSTPSQHLFHLPQSTIKPTSTTPCLALSPYKVSSAQAASTTPARPPPSNVSRMPSALATPSMRMKAPSPLSSRTSAGKTKAGNQPTLDSFLLKKDLLMDVDREAAPPMIRTPESSENIASPTAPIDTALVELKISPHRAERSAQDEGETHPPKSDVTVNLMQEPPIPKMAPLTIPKSSSIRNMNSMGPPSRIPISRPSNAASSSAIPLTVKRTESQQSLARNRPASTLPERRPSSRPSLVPTPDLTSTPEEQAVNPVVKRKPSYPSSLGSGPLSRPTQRIVSNPVVQPRSTSNPSPTPDDAMEPAIHAQGQRSVSAPIRSRLSLSTREGLNSETSKSLAGLSDALSKLKAKRTEGAGNTTITSIDIGSTSKPRQSISELPSISISEHPVDARARQSNLSASTSRLSASGHRPRGSVLPGTGNTSISSDEDGNETNANINVGDTSIAALLCSTNGARCLEGVRAFVDVRTADGEDSSRIFIDILKGLGARVFVKPSERCTHIIYKSGKPSTLAWYRKFLDEHDYHQEQHLSNPQTGMDTNSNADVDEVTKEQEARKKKVPCVIVGIKWVMECKKSGKRLQEDKYLVDISQEDVFQKVSLTSPIHQSPIVEACTRVRFGSQFIF